MSVSSETPAKNIPAAPPPSQGEFADIEFLHRISVGLIGEQDSRVLYGRIVDAAVSIMRSQFGTMQVLCPPGDPSGNAGKLNLLAYRGLTPEAAKFWEWVGPPSHSSCTLALKTGARAIVPDFEKWDAIAGTEDLLAFRKTGIRSAQTTPLVSRQGKLLGMISTHWSEPHEPSERDLRLLDILAHQAADLLERTMAEEALRAREQLLDGILGATTDTFICFDDKFGITFVNHHAEERLGKSASELLGSNIWDLFPDAVGGVAHRELTRAMSDRAPVEFEHYYKPWSRWFLDKAYPTADGGLAVYSQDITERTRVQHALSDSQTRYRTLFDTIDEGFCIIEFLDGPHGPLSDYVHVEANPAYTANAGIPDVVGQRVRDMVPDEAEGWVQIYRKVLLTGEPVRFERELVATGRCLELAASRIEPVERRQVAVLFKDVTARKRAEEALRESEERLRMATDAASIGAFDWNIETGVNTWTPELEKMYGLKPGEFGKNQQSWELLIHPEDREEAVAAAERTLATGELIEHEWRVIWPDGALHWIFGRFQAARDSTGKPLRVTGVNMDITARKRAEELQKMLTGELSHRVKNMLATVQAIATQTLRHSRSAADFVTSFGGRIQSMSRVHSQLSSNEWKGAQLRDIVQDQINLGPADETRISASGPDVRLDAQTVPKMAMIMHELGTNSIKYGALSRPNGAVAIKWTVSNNTLDMRWTESGGPRVKAPIQRGFGATLIEQSAVGAGGKARMSLEADGVQWEITLPLPEVSAASIGAANPSGEERVERKLRTLRKAAASSSRTLAGKRVLIVEDEPLVAMELADHLAEAGAEIVGPVGNVPDALILIGREQFDAALLDANLAGMPVDDVAAALTRKNVPFAFVSGYGPESLPRSFAAAATLSKPFSAQQLLQLAAQLLDERADALRPKHSNRT